MAAKKKSRPSRGRQSGAHSRQSKAAKKKPTPKPLNRASAEKRMAADLKKSNLTMADGKKRGFKLKTPKQTKALTKTAKYPGAYVWSYLIPYYDIDGKLIKDYWRVRYLEEVTGPFGSKPKKPRRYTGPENARIRIYFDPTCNYKNVHKDGETVLVLEGEKKTACAVKDGHVAIGLGGVACHQQNGKPLPEFDLIDWQGLDVVLFFDSDYRGNPDVKRELNKLARERTRRGARVRRAEPPEGPDGEKWGYDDCRQHLGKRKTAKIIEEAKPFDLPPDLIETLNNVWYVAPEGANVRIHNEETGVAMREQDFKLLYANIRVEDHGGNLKPLGETWLKSPARRQYTQTIFDPDAVPDPYVFNRYKPGAIEPVKGKWLLLAEHIKRNICAGNTEHHEYVMNWLARGVQEASKRAETALVLRGGPGVGKGVFVEAYSKFFEPHFYHASSTGEIVGRFTEHLKDILLIFLDEAFYAGDKKHVGALKKMITEGTRAIEGKFKDPIIVTNRLKLILASNDAHVIPAQFLERRFMMLDVLPDRQQDTEFFGALKEQLKNGGHEAFLHDLLQRDISKFDHRDCPRTDALAEQQAYSFSEVESYWFEVLEDGVFPHRGAPIKGQNPSRDWGLIPKKILHDDFTTKARERGFARLPDVTQFRFRLSQMLPDGWPKNVRTNSGGKRVYCWEFPSLKVCRKSFEAVRVGGPKPKKSRKKGRK